MFQIALANFLTFKGKTICSQLKRKLGCIDEFVAFVQNKQFRVIEFHKFSIFFFHAIYCNIYMT